MTSQAPMPPKPLGFSLVASSRFVKNFPAGQGGEDAPRLALAFALDRSWHPVGVCVAETACGLSAEVVANPDGAVLERIGEDVVRILNLSVDHDPFIAIGERDPIVQHLRHQYPGLRPVQFSTPWEAAAWAIIGHRVRIAQAAKLKQRISERFGHRAEFPDGHVLNSFPAPDVILSLPAIPGLPVRKFDTLRGIAAAALDGKLASEHLLALPAKEAAHELRRLHGIGPFSAELILVRGAGHPDLFPHNEPRLARAMTALYSTDDHAEHARIAEQWRPYRSWVALLIRRWLEDETQEIANGARTGHLPTPSFARSHAY